MATVQKTIDVHVPVRMVYNEWIDFESFPRFMEGIEEVRRLDDRTYNWRASLYGKKEEWDAEVTEMVPDKRIAWRSISGPAHSGLVTFEPIDATVTRISLTMAYEPSGLLERAGDMLGLVDRRVDGDLHRFKEFVESEATVRTPPGAGTF